MRVFERHKDELCTKYPGQFAVVVGSGLWAVWASLEGALEAVSAELEAGVLPAHRPVLIGEIAEKPRLRVTTELRVYPVRPERPSPASSRRRPAGRPRR